MQRALARTDRFEPRFQQEARRENTADYAIASIKTALSHLEAGRTVEAVARLDRLSPADVPSAPACALAGLICISAGADRKAIAWLDQALAIGPPEPAILAHRANALATVGDVRQAIEAYEAAAAAGSTDPMLHYNRGNLLRGAGQLDRAIEAFDTALRLRPAFPDAMRAAGSVLRDLDHADGALRCFGEALRLKPDDLGAWLEQIALLHGLGRLDDARTACDRGLFHLPDHALLLGRRAKIDLALGRHEEAREGFLAALRGDATMLEAHRGLGEALIAVDEPDLALASFERALALDETDTDAAFGRSLALRHLGRFDAALAAVESLLTAHPDLPKARALRGELNLQRGEFERGWADREHRLATATSPLKGSVPVWTGGSCRAARMVVQADGSRAEQLLAARYLPLLTAAGAAVTLVCPPALHGLLGDAAGTLRLVEAVDEVGEVDLQVSLSSLPALFRTTLDTIPAAAGYLKPEPARVAVWARRLGWQGLKIGVCWSGLRGCAVPLRALAPLAALPDVRLIALQATDAADDAACRAMRIETLDEGFGAGADALADVAAVMSSLDLVVTCDSAIAHLAGALGRPVWLLLGASPDWTWMLETDESPWYASMRLFRQQQRGDWNEPVDVLTRAVAQWSEAWRAHRTAARAASRILPVALPLGDALDRLTILRLRHESVADAAERASAERDVRRLEAALHDALPLLDTRIGSLTEELAQVNRDLWAARDAMRDCSAEEAFAPLARSAQGLSTRRTALKREIDLVSGSAPLS